MSTINWQIEHERFMAVAYDKAVRAAKRAFRHWHVSKRSDMEAEFMAKLVDQWNRILEKGRSSPLKYPLLRSLLWVYDVSTR